MSEESALVVWTQDDIDALREKAISLANNPSAIQPHTAVTYMELELLLEEAAKRLLRGAVQEPKADVAARIAVAGAKLSGEWREGMLPVIKRIVKELGNESSAGKT